MKEANSVGLSSKWAKKVRNGAINIEEVKDENLWKKIDAYKKWYEAAISARDAIYSLKNTETDLWAQRFNILQKDYEDKIAQYQHVYDQMDSYIELAENTGRISANKYRKKQISQEQSKIAQLKKEYSSLESLMLKALKSGKLSKNSEEYYEWLGMLNSISEEIASCTANVAELNKSIRETNWEIFDKSLETISNMRDELEFVYDLLGDEENFFDERGIVNETGIAGFGVLASQYNVAAAEAQKYAKAVTDINKQLASDPYNQDIVDRQQDLYESWRKSLSAVNDYKEAMRDLVETGIKAQISSLKDLISKYTDLIDTQKDEIDYAKRVSTAQEDINKIQKQLNAYENDNSEEGATRRQKLRNDLKTAQENLAQTQEERRISQTKKLLSDLQDEYEDVLNARLDNLDALVQNVIEGVDANATTIKDAISTATSDVGYILSDYTSKVFDSGLGTLASYFTNGGFVEKVTSISNAVSTIEQYYKNAEANANSNATSNIKSAARATQSTASKVNSAAATGVKKKNSENKTSGIDGSWIKDKKGNRTGWKFSDGTKATGWSKIDNKWYYFDSKGNMKSGMQTIDKNKYYIRRASGRATSEWVQVNKKWYYFDKNGKAVSGWRNLTKDGKKSWFYFDPSSNAMKTNSWIKNSSKKGTYYVDAQGRMLINGKFKTKDGYRTFDKNGKWKGYRSGVKSVGAEGLYWTNEGAPETIIRKSDGAVLTKLKAGDTVLNNKATNNMWDFSNNPQKFLRGLGLNGGTGNDVDLVINLNGIKNPSEFMDALRKDKKFEKFLQEVTIGRVAGHGALAKNAIAF